MSQRICPPCNKPKSQLVNGSDTNPLSMLADNSRPLALLINQVEASQLIGQLANQFSLSR